MARSQKAHHLRNPEPVVEYRKALNKTDDRTAEWLDNCRKGAGDFVFFCEYFVGVRVHPGQLSVIDAINVADYGVLAAANGWGKTFFYALLILWASFAKKWAPQGWGIYRVAVLGPQMQQSLITHAEVENLRNNNHEAQIWCNHQAPCVLGLSCPDRKKHQFRLGPWLIPFKTEATHLAYRWKHNGALIHFESGENKAANVEGWKLNLIVYDEARLELHLKHIMDQVFLARATRTPNQKIILGSTPLSDSYDLLDYYRRGESGKPNWWSHLGSIRENCFLSPEQVQKVRDALDQRIADQVLEGKWVEPPDAYFIRDKVDECFDPGPNLPPGIESYSGKTYRGGMFAAGLDVAVAEGGDESVLAVWDVSATPNRLIVEKVWPKGTPLGDVVAYCDVIIQEFGCAIAFDASGPLGMELEHQVSHNPTCYIPIKFTGGNQQSQAQMKVQTLANFRHFINNKLVWFPYLPETRKQIVSYNYPKDQNLRKDRLMANVLAAWLAKDYINQINFGMHINVNGPAYKNAGTSYGGNPRPEWANKSPLQRRLLKLSEQRDAQRVLEEVRNGG